MIVMLNPELRQVLDGTPIAHLATILPDGAPHAVPLWISTHGDYIAIITGPGYLKTDNMHRDPRVALSLTPVDDPYRPIVIRGKVVQWLDGEQGWEIVDKISTKYTGNSYSREEERVIALIEPTRQRIG
ncbi:PPOX class probable F420-dependent enzyme [Nocardia sp. GAS34]|uniref:PPOX class F420-dependent oxidoreductase n=1 Tax=unclassified Nocardia TaxID=2637762 RepID=UPI003D1B7755